MTVQYFSTRDFTKSLGAAIQMGGQTQKTATKVRAILGSIDTPDPFAGFPRTHNGETRIPNCVKYDLGNGWRLVTQQTDKACFFLFVGNHDDVDAWLEAHKGQRFGLKGGTTVSVPGYADTALETRTHYADHHDRSLAELLDAAAMDHVLDLPRSIAKRLELLTGTSTSADIEAIASDIQDPQKAALVRAVFNLLLVGDHDGARAHIDVSMGLIKEAADWSDDDVIEVSDGADVRRIRIGSNEYGEWLTAFEKQRPWYEWFLYLHPEQEKVVKAEYPGPAQLSGVSGSGKTCVTVRRALRLAGDTDGPVLVLTLNRSLACLLRQLVEAACNDPDVLGRVRVTSFFELAQELLRSFEPGNDRLYADVSWKLGEHVDEVFREYYRCWTNNRDAAVLSNLHRSITSRGVSGEHYIREEFDWIRSAFEPNARRDYLTKERKGRRFPISDDRRNDVLRGLEGWEKKMRDVGVIDYLGLTSALSAHTDKIKPLFNHILVDEAQDFGTTELRIIRKLVQPGKNYIFLCGDIAQTILPKHRSLTDAGFPSISREKIRQNYRNSREILHAAYDVLRNNISEELFDSDDLEILDPKFANFSGPTPMALAASSLEMEIGYARTYANTRLAQGTKSICIAFAGFSARDVRGFAQKCGVTALDGTYDPRLDPLVFCDLEQTKGYEFETLIILNCTDGVLPPYDAPKEEEFRTSCKLYVAMTRAKRELLLSFHDALCPWIRAVTGSIATAMWSDVEALDLSTLNGIPESIPEVENRDSVTDVEGLTGLEFVYTPYALGLSVDALDKVISLVDGKGTVRVKEGRTSWRTVGSLFEDLRVNRRRDHYIGTSVAQELRAFDEWRRRTT